LSGPPTPAASSSLGVKSPDTDDDLNWHAFLGHSIDMQGFRAAEFVGVDPLTRAAPCFVPLRERGIGVRELATLWEKEPIRQHLLHSTKGTPWLRRWMSCEEPVGRSVCH
jgi:hypothetical protein